MPEYFYHLKFELYSAAAPPREANSKAEQRHTSEAQSEHEGEDREIWVPPPGTNIFDSKAWPRHPLAATEREYSREDYFGARGRPVKGFGTKNSTVHGGSRSTHNAKESLDPRDEQLQKTVGAVIDCGPSRSSTAPDHSVTPVAAFISSEPRDQKLAVQDWRFGRVRFESIDMVSEMEKARPGVQRGESSTEGLGHNTGEGIASSVSGGNGINAGLTAGGRVTKARYEAVEGGNTEVGWGIVHLYRDGEETSGLGASGSATADLYSSPGETSALDEEGEDCTTLCIPAVPSYLTPSDFLGFVGEKTRQEVSHFRMVMTGRMNRYLVLMKFRDSRVARRWRKEWDGKVFNSMEPETCHVTIIKSIIFQTTTPSTHNTSFPELSHDPFTPSPMSAPTTTSSTSTYLKPFPPPTPSLIELPTCPVCLERMDDTTGLLTILCQHVFHCDCLQKWRGTGCPVCRHTNPSLALSASQSPSNPSQNSNSLYDVSPTSPPFGSGAPSLCSVCDCTDDLWICLICGSVGCGRYKGGHAKEHWKESAHNFALEIETQHVWDYADDVWVHRLIRGKGDSKVIELPYSRSSQSNGGNGRDRNNNGDYGGGGYGGDGDMVPREKLEAIGMEYTHLLTSQLESQRVYFESLLSASASKASSTSSTLATLQTTLATLQTTLSALQLSHANLKDEVAPALEKDLAREKKKAEKSADLARGLSKGLVEEKKVSEGLMERIRFLEGEFGGMKAELSTVKAALESERESNRDLMFALSGGEKLKELNEGVGGEGEGLERGEVEGAMLEVGKSGGNARKKMKGKGK